MLLVPFEASANGKIEQTQCRVVQKQGAHKIRKKMSKIRFGVDLELHFGTIFVKSDVSL